MPGQLAEMKKLYWVAKPRKVVAKIAERLKIPSSSNFAKVPKLNEEITRKFFPTTNGQTFRNQEVWQPLQHCKCLTFVSLGIDLMIVFGKVSQLILAERKDKLKYSLNVDIKFVTTTIQHLIIWRKHRKA